MTTDAPKRRDGFTLFLGVATALLAVLVLLLARQNRNLKAELSALATGLPPGALKSGDLLAPFDLIDADGKTTHVGFDGHGETLLLVFSATCGACQETLPVWDRLLKEPPRASLHVIGIQTDFPREPGAPNPLALPDLPFPVFGAPTALAAAPLTKFPSIPAAALLDGKGAVTAVWFGVPTDAQVSEMRRALAG
jgi:thiol-disulfide isomerase/thioredoxin